MSIDLHQIVTGQSRPIPRLGLRALAWLLGYPDAQRRSQLPEIAEVLVREGGLSARRLAGLHALIAQLQGPDPMAVEAEYVELFDRGRATSLHLFEHVHGDSRDRGPAMVDLIQTYEQSGLLLRPDAHGELPDYLPTVLEFTSTLDGQAARDFTGEFAHILNALHGALAKRQSLYAHIPAAVLEWMGHPLEASEPLPDEPMDAVWAEPPAFNGCSTSSRPAGFPQPVHIVRTQASTPSHPNRGGAA